MSAIDNIARAQAQSAITKYGKALTFRKKTIGVHNPVTHQLENGENEYVIRALIEDYSLREINGTTILQGDMKLTVAAKGNEVPEVGWWVDLITSVVPVKYNVVSVGAIYSGEQVALYICQVRK